MGPLKHLIRNLCFERQYIHIPFSHRRSKHTLSSLVQFWHDNILSLHGTCLCREVHYQWEVYVFIKSVHELVFHIDRLSCTSMTYEKQWPLMLDHQVHQVRVACCVHGGHNDVTKLLGPGTDCLIPDQVQPWNPFTTTLWLLIRSLWQLNMCNSGNCLPQTSIHRSGLQVVWGTQFYPPHSVWGALHSFLTSSL